MHDWESYPVFLISYQLDIKSRTYFYIIIPKNLGDWLPPRFYLGIISLFDLNIFHNENTQALHTWCFRHCRLGACSTRDACGIVAFLTVLIYESKYIRYKHDMIWHFPDFRTSVRELLDPITSLWTTQTVSSRVSARLQLLQVRLLTLYISTADYLTLTNTVCLGTE